MKNRENKNEIQKINNHPTNKWINQTNKHKTKESKDQQGERERERERKKMIYIPKNL